MAIKPYNTRMKIISEARTQGHVVLPDNDVVTVDTGEKVFHVSEDGIKDEQGNDLTIDAAMDIVAKRPTA